MASADELRDGLGRRLEAYFQSPEVAERIGTFMHDELSINTLFEGGIDPSREQSLGHHEAYRRYCAMVEGLLTGFAERQGATAAELEHVVAQLPADEVEAVVCGDYLRAAVKYEDFLGLVDGFLGMYGRSLSEYEGEPTR
eukprot:TRINITY_DN4819_c0_g1_i1.p1 TRINITY_DN4819_c0_g1~~TRINITY_DN4819_c0_g1_i1.p1  ORF type:complete len:140 (-),score=32.73 TRINITY_DN4819_c0_g1_i1:33-452(-)